MNGQREREREREGGRGVKSCKWLALQKSMFHFSSEKRHSQLVAVRQTFLWRNHWARHFTLYDHELKWRKDCSLFSRLPKAGRKNSVHSTRCPPTPIKVYEEVFLQVFWKKIKAQNVELLLFTYFKRQKKYWIHFWWQQIHRDQDSVRGQQNSRSKHFKFGAVFLLIKVNSSYGMAWFKRIHA